MVASKAAVIADAGGQVFVAFASGDFTHLQLATKSGAGTWSTPAVVDTEHQYADDPYLHVTGDGQLSIVFTGETPEGRRLFLAQGQVGAWSVEEVEACLGTPYGPVLDREDSGQLNVCYGSRGSSGLHRVCCSRR